MTGYLKPDVLDVREVNPPDTKWIGPETLLAAAQNFTAAWVDVGPEIPTAGATHLGVWLNLDVNDSLDMRIKALAKHTTAGADEYEITIRTLSATDIKVDAGYIEFNTDADQKVILSIPLDGVVPFVQLQIQAGTAGATPGQVDSLYSTKAWAGAGGGF
jgi:hypothetical protein